ncbi:MAG: molybdopterin molybdotransferase MoeA [Pseudomonadales bacterium]|nr:molybdopterin molybdotransferase MoeA [Pseudomonadales bacterium]
MNKSERTPLTPIAEAIQQLLPTIPQMTDSEDVAPLQAAGRVLADDFKSPLSVPPCDNSAMDGYAVRTADLDNIPKTLKLSQRIAAGSVGEPLQPGEAARIFTGAPLPPNADAVVMQENTKQADAAVVIEQGVAPGENLRATGEDIQSGQILFQAGHRLRPQDIGVLSSVGCTAIEVRRKPKVALLTTGNELVKPGTELKEGQIFNSNFYSLSALLANLQVEVVDLGIVEDSFDSTLKVLQQAAAEADCIISTGGVSVGEEDHVKAAVEASGSLDLWKLAIKPGKPFASGKVNGTQFFGLPGNPVSAFVTFVLLVRPLILTMLGCERAFPQWLPIAAGFQLSKSGERQEYIRVSLLSEGESGLSLLPFENQSSGVGASLSGADGLAIIPPYTAVAQDDLLQFLPFSELIF